MAGSGSRQIVAVSPVAPWPVRDGFTLRIASILEALIPRTSLLLVSPEPCPEEEHPPPGIEHRPYAARRVNGGPPVLSMLGTDIWPYPFDPEPLTDTLRSVARAHPDADVLCWSGAELSAVEAFGREICLDLVDCFSLQAYRSARTEEGMLSRIGTLKDAAVHWAYEWSVVSQPSMVLVAGTDDGRAIRQARGSGPVRVLANGVCVDTFRPREGRERTAPVAVFHGSLDYEPNVAALRVLERNVWPRVRGHVPDARLLVVGRRPTPEVRDLDRRPGIEVVGPVDDMAAALSRATVSVAPMVSGTGIKNKVLEAWAMELPVVTTRLGTNGIEETAREAALVDDDPAGFADAVIRLFRDPALRERLGGAGGARVRERHTWSAVAGQVEDLLMQTRLQPA